ncbi:hypothetical protein F5B20DRAFT_549143 [Whalleya microplaca]|nr:hypothetical protein F5B20DRAFT_549143 [Whalleya microplaca]
MNANPFSHMLSKSVLGTIMPRRHCSRFHRRELTSRFSHLIQRIIVICTRRGLSSSSLHMIYYAAFVYTITCRWSPNVIIYLAPKYLESACDIAQAISYLRSVRLAVFALIDIEDALSTWGPRSRYSFRLRASFETAAQRLPEDIRFNLHLFLARDVRVCDSRMSPDRHAFRRSIPFSSTRLISAGVAHRWIILRATNYVVANATRVEATRKLHRLWPVLCPVDLLVLKKAGASFKILGLRDAKILLPILYSIRMYYVRHI